MSKSPSNCLHASSSVNTDDLAIDPLSVLRCEEADNASDINWKTDAVERRPCGCVLVDSVIAEVVSSWDILSADLVVHISLDSTGSNAVDCDLLVTHI